MACTSGEPTSAEEESQLVAQLICHTLKKMRKTIKPYYRDTANGCYGDVGGLDELTDTLCGILGSLTDKEEDRIVYDARDKTARKLADWWEEHQILDRKRSVKERKKAKDAKIKKGALAKLSSEEKKVLGLK